MTENHWNKYQKPEERTPLRDRLVVAGDRLVAADPAGHIPKSDLALAEAIDHAFTLSVGERFRIESCGQQPIVKRKSATQVTVKWRHGTCRYDNGKSRSGDSVKQVVRDAINERALDRLTMNAMKPALKAGGISPMPTRKNDAILALSGTLNSVQVDLLVVAINERRNVVGVREEDYYPFLPFTCYECPHESVLQDIEELYDAGNGACCGSCFNDANAEVVA